MSKFVFLFALLFGILLAEPALSAPTVCTMEYAPVCGTKEVQCIRAPCYPVHQTYSNNCMLAADNAVFRHAGECTEKEQQWGGVEESENPPASPSEDAEIAPVPPSTESPTTTEETVPAGFFATLIASLIAWFQGLF